jgi:outer membrane lipoprotein SlyB
MSKIIGTFASRDSAESCIRELRNSGFDHNRISLVARESGKKDEGGQGFGATMAGDDTAFGGTATGGAIGGVAGLLAGLGALAIPGIGPIVAAGPIAATLTGAVGGGLVGGLVDMGIPQERGEFYEGKVREGRILAVVDAGGDKVNDAARIMRDYGASDVETH